MGAGSAATIFMTGCSASQPKRAEASEKAARGSSRTRQAAMTVYRDPSCGCCEAWARLARDAGFDVALIDEPDMPTRKRTLGVPEELASCHTAVVGDRIFEGHVPFDQVDRLLRMRPAGISGLAVPGMPVGSPGMETPDARRDPYQVIAFGAGGRSSIFFQVT